MTTEIKEKLLKQFSRIETFIVPSGLEVTIREQNGDDDDVLTRVNQADFKSINLFMQGIIVCISDKLDITYEDIMNLRLRDKYYSLIKSRIFSIGHLLNFQYTWPNGVVNYEQDLNDYVPNYEETLPEKNEKGYYKYRINKYPDFKKFPLNKHFEFKVGEKELRAKYYDGMGEKFLLNLPSTQQSINSELLARNLEFKMGSEWLKVTSFNKFSTPEMNAIRKYVKDFDERFDGLMELENPYTGEVNLVNLLALPDFFFPLGI